MSPSERDGPGLLQTANRETFESAPAPPWSYDRALSYLKSRERYGVKFGLENIGRLVTALGNPERRYETLLVAGTNGKGSVAAMLASILRASGLRTGRYTSPHIRFLEERIAVEGSPIGRSELAQCVARVASAAQSLWPEGGAGADDEEDASAPTFFEATTACAFLAFAEAAVDFAVLEVGMGGRYDATNVAPASLSVITPIGFDHERFLGSTLSAIASEKAAVIKEGRPVVIGRLARDARDVVATVAKEKGARLVEAIREVELEATPEGTGQRVLLRTTARDYGVLHLPLSGRHQLDNLAVAVRAAELVLGESLRVESVREGVASTSWPGRLQRIEGRPSMLLDAAHNVMAVEALADYLQSQPPRDRVLLFGVMKDKRVFEILGHLLPHVSHLVATKPRMSRARGPEAMSRWAAERGTPSVAIRSTRDALARARALAGPDGEVLVAGSIFLLGEVMNVLAEEPSHG